MLLISGARKNLMQLFRFIFLLFILDLGFTKTGFSFQCLHQDHLLFPNKLHNLPVNGIGGHLFPAAESAGVKPLDINDWEQASILDIVPHTFPWDSFGLSAVALGTDVDVIADMCLAFQNYNCPHIALVRIVMDDVNSNRYFYSIPYVFVSGRSGQNAILKWNNNLGLNNNHQAKVCPLINAINNVAQNNNVAPINLLTKGINDYGFNAKPRFLQRFAHSERAIILALLYDKYNSLEDAITTIPESQINEVTIQIKIINPMGVCSSCNMFLAGNPSKVSMLPLPNAFGQARINRDINSNFINFKGKVGKGKDLCIYNCLSIKSGIPLGGGALKIRISHSVAGLEF